MQASEHICHGFKMTYKCHVGLNFSSVDHVLSITDCPGQRGDAAHLVPSAVDWAESTRNGAVIVCDCETRCRRRHYVPDKLLYSPAYAVVVAVWNTAVVRRAG